MTLTKFQSPSWHLTIDFYGEIIQFGYLLILHVLGQQQQNWVLTFWGGAWRLSIVGRLLGWRKGKALHQSRKKETGVKCALFDENSFSFYAPINLFKDSRLLGDFYKDVQQCMISKRDVLQLFFFHGNSFHILIVLMRFYRTLRFLWGEVKKGFFRNVWGFCGVLWDSFVFHWWRRGPNHVDDIWCILNSYLPSTVE